MKYARAFVFLNGEINHPEKLLAMLNAEVYLVAVDGGLRHLLALNMKPHILIGDLDSVHPAELKWAQEQGIPIVQLPVKKDETDLEAALQHIIELGILDIVLLAAIGNRIDHTLANIFILTKPDFNKHSIRIWDGNQEISVITESMDIFGNKGDLLSLLPLSERVLGVTTEGLEYPLEHEALYVWNARGVSNVMSSHHANVTVLEGNLLCIHFKSMNGQEKENLL
ncbi:MAG: thiamine diphosphokinase [Chloroflexi bacterium 44-23]|nr:MAG: thiamine diphosphokinase [Chloroflexi bacterium 44-23]